MSVCVSGVVLQGVCVYTLCPANLCRVLFVGGGLEVTLGLSSCFNLPVWTHSTFSINKDQITGPLAAASLSETAPSLCS